MVIGVLIALAIVIVGAFLLVQAINRNISRQFSEFKGLVKSSGSAISFKKNIEKSDLPIVEMTINGKKRAFLLDSGADINCLDVRVFNLINKESILDVIKQGTVSGLKGENIAAKLCKLKFSYEDKYFDEEFAVLEIQEGLKQATRGTNIRLCGVIGSKFFQKYKWQLDFNEMVVRIDK